MVTLTPDPEAPVPSPGDWRVTTVDVEGGAQRLRAAAETLAEDGAAPATMPAMRTAGIQLLRPGRSQDLTRRRNSALQRRGLAAGEVMVLDADDLVLGYRIDVRWGGGDWCSLHRRLATYYRDDPDDPIGAPGQPEEGHLNVAGGGGGGGRPGWWGGGGGWRAGAGGPGGSRGRRSPRPAAPRGANAAVACRSTSAGSSKCRRD